MQVDSLRKGKRKGNVKHQNQKGNRTTTTTNTSSTDNHTCKNVVELDTGLSCNPDVEQKGWIMGLTINSVSSQGDKLMQSNCFLTVVHRFTHVQSSNPDKKYRCLMLKFTHQVVLDSNMTEDDW